MFAPQQTLAWPLRSPSETSPECLTTVDAHLRTPHAHTSIQRSLSLQVVYSSALWKYFFLSNRGSAATGSDTDWKQREVIYHSHIAQKDLVLQVAPPNQYTVFIIAVCHGCTENIFSVLSLSASLSSPLFV